MSSTEVIATGKISAYGDRSFTFVTKTPPASFFLKKAAGIEKGSQTVGKGPQVGKVTMAQIREIAETKMADLNANDVDAAARMIVGSARSMGLRCWGSADRLPRGWPRPMRAS